MFSLIISGDVYITIKIIDVQFPSLFSSFECLQTKHCSRTLCFQASSQFMHFPYSVRLDKTIKINISIYFKFHILRYVTENKTVLKRILANISAVYLLLI